MASSITRPSDWSIVEEGFDPATAKAFEGLFTLGSGFLHARGSLEERLLDAPQDAVYDRSPANVTSEVFRERLSKWGTFVPAIYGPHPRLNNEIVNLPWFLWIEPHAAGEKLDMLHSRVESHRRELNLRTAVLSRELTWRTRAGPVLRLRFVRFISAACAQLCCQRVTIETDRPVDLVVRAGIDAAVRTNGYDHFRELGLSAHAPAAVACRVTTDGGDEVSIVSVVQGDSETPRTIVNGQRAWVERPLSLAPGRPATFEKRTAVSTSRHPSLSPAAACLDGAANRSWDDLLAEHAALWDERWTSCDVQIDGDADSQRALRAALFHLLRAHPNDDRVAIDAKGYAGEAYWGRFFWDTEIYLLPFFLYTDPPRARSLVDFRLHSLPGAMANAARYGYRGAKYAWESDMHGAECCPNFQYADHEIHVTADVAYAMAHYAAAADESYLRGPAARVLVETARYWLDRVDQRPGDAHLSLLGVMGPDEYTPISSNNAYTNRMAAFALDCAARHGEYGGAGADECRAFAAAAARLPVPRGSDGLLVLQCEEFPRLAEPRFDELWRDRTRSFAAQVSQERLYRSKCLKQADVLMLPLLFPCEWTPEMLRRAWDCYLPCTTHDSSLSPGVHAILALELGKADEAWSFWKKASGLDLDVAHGGAAEGIHIACAAATWMAAVFGFAGLRTALAAGELTLRPRLPAAWKRMSFPIVWKGCRAMVTLTHRDAVVENRGAAPLPVRVGQQREVVPAGGRRTWSLES